MAPRSGEELKEELESRQDSRIVRALEMVAPGTALREGVDNILHAHSGGPITISPPECAWRMLSTPSRSAVPGATISSALTIRESCRDSSSSLSSSPDRGAMRNDFTSYWCDEPDR